MEFFFTPVTLKFDGWPWKTIGHFFYATSSFLHNCVAICEFKLELQSRNTQMGAQFVLTSLTLTFDLWPWPFAWTSLLAMAKLPENFTMIRWKKHNKKGVTDGQTETWTDWTIRRAAWSQLKIYHHHFLKFILHVNTIVADDLVTPDVWDKYQVYEIDWSHTRHKTTFLWWHKGPVTSQLTNLIKWTLYPSDSIKIYVQVGTYNKGSMLRAYCQTCNISSALIGKTIVDHSDVVGASPVGAAPTTPSFST